jgi:hypothetical protein
MTASAHDSPKTPDDALYRWERRDHAHAIFRMLAESGSVRERGDVRMPVCSQRLQRSRGIRSRWQASAAISDAVRVELSRSAISPIRVGGARIWSRISVPLLPESTTRALPDTSTCQDFSARSLRAPVAFLVAPTRMDAQGSGIDELSACGHKVPPGEDRGSGESNTERSPDDDHDLLHHLNAIAAVRR